MAEAGFTRSLAAPVGEGGGPSVAWTAVFAGAVVAAAFAIALLALGAGIGLGSVSPWSNNNVSATTFGSLAAAWLIAVQLFSSGIGGYLVGRLRMRWVSVHADEAYFRDTAHGLLVWAVGAVISAFLLSSAVSSVAAGAARAGVSAVQAVGSAAGASTAALSGQVAPETGAPSAYFTDMLFRTDRPGAPTDSNASQAETLRIFARALSAGELPVADKSYLAQVVATRTGLSPADAEKRVSDVFDQAKMAASQLADKAKTAADVARKTGIYVSLWAFVALLVGAFSASFMATIGGRVRDDLPLGG